MIELRAKARSRVDASVIVGMSISMVLIRDGVETIMAFWNDGVVYQKEPEDMASAAVPYFVRHEIVCPGLEVLIAMFVMAKKAVMKMVAIVCTELLISHLSRDEMGEAWENANVLRVMTE